MKILLILLTALAVHASDRRFNYAGMPQSSEHLLILTNTAYLVGYSEARKNPAWVSYRIFKVVDAESPPRPSGFTVDDRTVAKVSQSDYTRSGYDRGHMAPNYVIGSRYGALAQRETFLMSNIVPQKPKLNRVIWRLLEKRVAEDWSIEFDEVWITTGPIYKGKARTLKSGVRIPTACFKIMVDEYLGNPRAVAWIVQQDVNGQEHLEQFKASVDEVELQTGLDFLSELDDLIEAEVER